MNEPFASAIVVKYPNYSGAAKPLYSHGKIEHARILLSRPARKGYPLTAKSHHPPRKGYQQDALFAAKTVELSPRRKVALFALN